MDVRDQNKLLSFMSSRLCVCVRDYLSRRIAGGWRLKSGLVTPHLSPDTAELNLLRFCFPTLRYIFKKLPSCVQYITLTIDCIIAVRHLKHPQGWLIIVCGKEKIHFIQTDTHCCLWDRMTHWLYNSITLPCFCAFHALRSQGKHWGAAEGTPYYQAAQSAGKRYTATLNKEKEKKKQAQVDAGVPSEREREASGM